jgi:hypothetical protein
MAAAAISLLLLVVVSALSARGARVPGWTAGIGVIVLGVLSIAGPADSSSLGIGWGIAAIAGGIVVVGLTEWQIRGAGALIGGMSHPALHPEGPELDISR